MLEITPQGLVGSQRGVEDGNVYFGTLRHSMPDIKGKYTVLNDFVLPPFQHPQQSQNYNSQHPRSSNLRLSALTDS